MGRYLTYYPVRYPSYDHVLRTLGRRRGAGVYRLACSHLGGQVMLGILEVKVGATSYVRSMIIHEATAKLWHDYLAKQRCSCRPEACWEVRYYRFQRRRKW